MALFRPTDRDDDAEWVRGMAGAALLSERLRHLLDALTKAK